MDKKAVEEIVKRFCREIEAQGVYPQKVILYGSYATGTFREDSDIDLVVISRDFAGKDFWERIEILAKAVYVVFQPIEAVAMTPEEWERGDSMIADFARNGEVLYSGKG
ncbi:MAG: nucleotidyltransferase domain-containing protein [Nitrospinae bacterium]|nr:nucleotidyltransferase domain-containing protein [Nitrospinota bacterium]